MPGLIQFINDKGDMGWLKYESPSGRRKIIKEFLRENQSDTVLYVSILPQTNVKYIDALGRNTNKGIQRKEDKLLR